MFSNGPFSHTGLKADIALSDDVSLMLGVLNSTDYTESQPVGDDYMFGAQLGLYGQYINLLIWTRFLIYLRLILQVVLTLQIASS